MGLMALLTGYFTRCFGRVDSRTGQHQQPSPLRQSLLRAEEPQPRCGTPAAARLDSLVTVRPENAEQQAFEGWGTSLCWFANIIGAYPDPLREHLADLLFSAEHGLGLQICRYNIGGSGWQNRDTGNFRYGADISSFWGPNQEWDWSLDAGQRWTLLAARDRGACVFEAFSNSPPYWMTFSGRASGNRFAWLDNLRPEFYDAFVHYLSEVVLHYHKEYGLTFRTLDPFNEPSTNYWWAGNNQEGCHFGWATQNELLVRLHKALAAKGLLQAGVQLSASDETSIDDACNTLGTRFQLIIPCRYSPEALACISQINTHAYQGSRRADLRDAVQRKGVPRLWMSEVGFGSSPPQEMGSALQLSAIILADLNAYAWVYWQAIENGENGGTWWGFIQVPFRSASFVQLGKQYYCMMQYSRWIRNGSRLVLTSRPDNTLAAINTDGGLTQVVLVSTEWGGGSTMDYDLSSFEAAAKVDVYRTSISENATFVESFSKAAPIKFRYALPPRSITTFVINLE